MPRYACYTDVSPAAADIETRLAMLTGATDASYLVVALNGNLTSERVLAVANGLSLTDGGAGGSVTIGVTGLAASLITSGLLAVARGGTGFGTFADGDLLVGSSTALAKLALGGARKFLRVNSTATALAYDDGQPALFDAGNSGTSKAIDWANGSVQKLTLTGNATITFSNATAGGSYALVLVQDATGGRTVSLTGWGFGDNPPTYNTTANKKNLVVGLYDGSGYLAVHSVKGA